MRRMLQEVASSTEMKASQTGTFTRGVLRQRDRAGCTEPLTLAARELMRRRLQEMSSSTEMIASQAGTVQKRNAQPA